MEKLALITRKQVKAKPQCPICASLLLQRYSSSEKETQINYQPHDALYRSYCRRCGYGS